MNHEPWRNGVNDVKLSRPMSSHERITNSVSGDNHRTTPKKRHFISNDLSAYLWFKLIEAPSGVLAKESKIVLTKFRQRCIYVISGISMWIFLCICLSFYFSWRNLDGADVPESEILSDTFRSLSANSLGIFFDQMTRRWNIGPPFLLSTLPTCFREEILILHPESLFPGDWGLD